MTQLINKGGFRERANRSRKYKQSENELTTLLPNQYRAGLKETDQHAQPEQQQDNPSKNKA